MIRACPTDVVHAAADAAWALLRDPRALDAWWDARLVRATPEGPLSAGQHLEASASGLAVRFDVLEVDEAARQLRMHVELPLGIADEVTITVVPIDAGRCRVSYG